MGSHIDVFFPHDVERSIEAVRGRLELAFGELTDELASIRLKGWSSKHDQDWVLQCQEGIVDGEGPNGFMIVVGPKVVNLTSLERFGAIERADQGIQLPLRRVFEVTAAAFSTKGTFAVSGGGYGETDGALSLTLEGKGFDEVVRGLEAHFGHPPARSWEAMDGNDAWWYLSAPEKHNRA